jgi:purine-nucleoside phosphorylase
MSTYEHVSEAAGVVRRTLHIEQVPDVAVVLGSGLGRFASTLESPRTLAYGDVPHWPSSTAVGHEGRLAIGQSTATGGRTVAALAGRAHAYEGYDFSAVAFAVRVVGLLGVKTLILTNAAGGIRTTLSPGALMVIDDHINLMGGNPLTGANDERFGPRFPDMTEVYSSRLRGLADEAAAALGLALSHGVYVGLHGPSYETPAEIRHLRAIGADAVGMSTIPEAIAARHMGLDVLGISCISNMAAGVLPEPLSHDDVLATAERVSGQFVALLHEIVRRV